MFVFGLGNCPRFHSKVTSSASCRETMQSLNFGTHAPEFGVLEIALQRQRKIPLEMLATYQ